MCVIQGTSQTEQKIILLFPLMTVHIFSVVRSHEVHRKGRDLGTLYVAWWRKE